MGVFPGLDHKLWGGCRILLGSPVLPFTFFFVLFKAMGSLMKITNPKACSYSTMVAGLPSLRLRLSRVSSKVLGGTLLQPYHFIGLGFL